MFLILASKILVLKDFYLFFISGIISDLIHSHQDFELRVLVFKYVCKRLE